MDKRVTCSFLFALLLLATAKARAAQVFPPSNIPSCNAGTALAWAGPGTDVYCKVLPSPPPPLPPPPPPPAAPPPAPPPAEPSGNGERDISGKSDGLTGADLGFGDGFGGEGEGE